jgi:hypothetical protein
VSYGVLNLTHRDGSRAPRPLRRGEPTTVRLELNDLAHAFPAGHRIRVAISNAYWPIVWPAARPARLSVSPRGATLDLPVHQRRDEPALSPLPPAASAPVPPSRRERPVRLTRKTFVDPKTGEQVTRVRDDGGAWRDDEGLVQDWVGTQEYRIRPDAPLSAWARVTSTSRVERGDWKTRVEVETVQSAAERTFRVQTRLRAWENGALVFDRAWDQRVPRGL